MINTGALLDVVEAVAFVVVAVELAVVVADIATLRRHLCPEQYLIS